MNFSVVLIARNESKTLPNLMASLKEFQARGGEVVLMDTGSTDDTAKLARELGCKVTEVGERFITTLDADLAKAINDKFVVLPDDPIVKAGDRLFDYSAARNHASTLASQDMIATPDCDEAYTVFDLDRINQEIANGAEQLEYAFVFSHDVAGNPAIKFNHCKFYDRRKLAWKGMVHEVLAGSAKRVWLDESVIRLEHWQNPSTHRSNYLVGLALDCYLNPDNDRNQHYLARELMWAGRKHSAIREFYRHVEMKRWPQERAQSMIFMGDCLEDLGHTDDAVASWQAAISVDSSRRAPWLRLARYYWKHNDPQRAAAYASAALTIQYCGFYADHMNEYREDPHEVLFWALWHIGDRASARIHWRKALEYQPHNQKYWTEAKWFLDGPHREHRLGLWAYMIREGIPFNFVKLGDGEEQCMNGATGQNCDGHEYSPELGERLRTAFSILHGRACVVHYHDQPNVNLLLHRTDANADALREFYSTLRNCHRKKVFVGPARLRAVSVFLLSRFVEVPLTNCFNDYDRILLDIRRQLEPKSIVCLSCGMTAKVLTADLVQSHPDVTCLDTGSAFDPIFVGQTRTFQEDRETLISRYSGLLPAVTIVIPSLGRPEKLARCVEAIHRNAGYDRYEVVIMEDRLPPDNIGVPKLLQQAVAQSDKPLVMFLANDCVPEKDFLLRAVVAMLDKFPDLDGMIGLNDGYWHGEFSLFWLAGRKLLPALGGEFFHTGYHHYGCDNELSARCQLLGKYAWCESAVARHQHEHDGVSEIALRHRDQDQALLKLRGKQFGFVVPDFYEWPK